MGTAISPHASALLAEEVYLVQNERTAKAFMSRPEFSSEPGASVTLKADVGYLLWTAKDAFGVFARGAGTYKDDLFLVFRGTTDANNNADWVSNVHVGIASSQTGLPVHAGFNRIFNSMLPGIRQFLAKQTTAIGTVHCVGHSLGGAVANLAADWVKKHHANPVKLYTFGAPRPGISWFARAMGNRVHEHNIYRVYHKTDPVPMVPIFPFMHAPLSEYGHQIHSSEAIVSSEAHGIGRYRESVASGDWKSLHGPLAPFQIDHILEQWLRSDSSPNGADSRIWEWLNSALIWVLKKVVVGGAMLAQSVFTSSFTLMDRLAWLLKTGIDFSKEGGFWVGRLMTKILQVLGMAVEGVQNLTQAFIRQVLMRLMQRMTQEAQAALRRVFHQR